MLLFTVPVVGFLLVESLPTQFVHLQLKQFHMSQDDGKNSSKLILPQSLKVGPLGPSRMRLIAVKQLCDT
jgi:hypothetical protein